MAPPVDTSVLASGRPDAMIADDEWIRLDHDVVLHPAFERMQHRRVAIVDGVGSHRPDGSHFEMLRRWWTGDPEGVVSETTGFLGRLCDVLDVGAPVTGLSIGGASTPALLAARAGTLGLPDPDWLWWMADDEVDEWTGTFRSGLAAMAEPDEADGSLLAGARAALGGGLGVGSMIGALGDPDGYPESVLGTKLAVASQVIASDVGVRVIHVSMDGDFDTHENHRDRHAELMGDLDGALDAFLADLESSGTADRVLVATTSEFGRRPEQNGNAGLDHGTASVALVAGPVNAGRHGPEFDATARDDDGNFVASLSFADYYATLAEGWFEIPATEVLNVETTPLAGVW